MSRSPRPSPLFPFLRRRSPRPLRRTAGVIAAVLALLMVASTAAQAAISPAPARTWGTNGRVLAILPIGDRVYIAGDFTAVIDPSSRTYPASRLAVYVPSTGRFDLGWNASADASVTALTAVGDQLYAGGSFTTVNGVKRKKLARLNALTGVLDPTWTPSVDRPPDALAAQGGRVYAAGPFTQAAGTGGVLSPRAFVARFDAVSGALDPGWLPTPNDRVLTVRPADDGSAVFIGGNFTAVSGVSAVGRIARVNTTTGGLVAGFVPGATNQGSKPPVFDIWLAGPDRVYVAVGGAGGACAALSATTGQVLWTKHTNGNLQGVRVVGDTVFCGGHFTGIGGFDGQTRFKLAAVDAASGATLPYAPVINSALGVWSLAADATHVYVGGDFTQIGTLEQPGFAAFTDDAAATAPAAPGELVAAPGDATVLLQWVAPSTDGGSGLQRYRVQRAEVAPGTDPATATWTVIGTSTTPDYTDATVVNAATYLYRVSAVNAVGESPAGNVVTATPSSSAATTPGVPGRFTVVGKYAANLLTWAAPDSGGSPITGYQVYRGTAAGTTTLLTTAAATATSFTDTDVVVGTRYYYRVSAVNALGEGGRSVEEWGVPTNGVPSAPVLSGTAAPGRTTLSWTPPARDGGSPVTQYVVLRDSIRVAVLPATTLTWVDTATVPGTSYAYRVKAQNANGSSPLSAIVVVKAQ